jgi:tetratricopeptide (TPR) repeat protein
MRSAALALVAGLAAAPSLLAAPLVADPRTPSPDGLTVEALLPNDVLAFGTFAGLDAASAAAEGLELLALIEEPEMQLFLEDLVAMIEAQSENVPAEVQEMWEAARRQLGGRMSMALGDLTLVWTQDGPIPLPGMLLALDTGEHRQEARESFEMLLGMAMQESGGSLTHSTRQHAGHDVSVLQISEDGAMVEIHVAFLENLVLFNLNGHLIDACLENAAAGGVYTLANSEGFARARRQSPGTPLFEMFLNTGEIGKRFEGLLPVEIKQACHDLGLDAIDSIYYASAIHDGDSLDTMYIDTPGGQRGLLALGGDRPIDDGALAIVPDSAVYCSALSLDASKAWDTVMSAVAAVAPAEVVAEMEREIARAEAEMGFAIRDGLLAALGDELVAYAELPQNGFIPGFVMTIELRDRAEGARILGTVLGASGASVRQVAFGARTLHVITIPDEDVPVSPCFSFEGDRLVFGLTVGALKDALTRMDSGGGRIVDSPHFQAAFRGLDRSHAGAIEFIDMRLLAAYGYDLAINMLPGYTDPNVPLDFAKLPAKETVLRHMGGWAEVARATDEGIVMQARTLSFATLAALVARGLDELPVPPLMMVSMEEEYVADPDYVQDPYWPEDPAEPVPPAPPATEPAAAPQPEGVVNPIDEDDPRVAQFEREIDELTAAIEANPQDGALYFNRGIRCGQLRRFDRAIKDYEIARELGYSSPTCAYNLACTHSLKGEIEEAFEWLALSFEEGFDSWGIVAVDSDLDALRKDERFEKLVSEYRDGL